MQKPDPRTDNCTRDAKLKAAGVNPHDLVIIDENLEPDNPYEKKPGFLSGLRRTLGKWARVASELVNGHQHSANEARLTANEYEVKAMLGKSFFTRKLTPRTRYRRIARLSPAQAALAERKGWI